MPIFDWENPLAGARGYAIPGEIAEGEIARELWV
jgi:hypothetical protein